MEMGILGQLSNRPSEVRQCQVRRFGQMGLVRRMTFRDDFVLTILQALVDRTSIMPLGLLVAPVAQIHPELLQSELLYVRPARSWTASL